MMKTRNDLNRLTYKINQLKSKPDCEFSQNYTSSFPDRIRPPLSHSPNGKHQDFKQVKMELVCYLDEKFRSLRRDEENTAEQLKRIEEKVGSLEKQLLCQENKKDYCEKLLSSFEEKLNIIQKCMLEDRNLWSSRGHSQREKDEEQKVEEIRKQIADMEKNMMRKLQIEAQNQETQISELSLLVKRYEKQMNKKYGNLEENIEELSEKIESFSSKKLSTKDNAQVKVVEGRLQEIYEQFDRKIKEITKKSQSLEKSTNGWAEKIEEIEERTNIERKEAAKKQLSFAQIVDLENLKNEFESSTQKIDIVMKERINEVSNMVNSLQQQVNKIRQSLSTCLSSNNYNQTNNLELKNSLILSESSKTVIERLDEATIGLIDEKLNQFEIDVNETIEALYKDVEHKMNEIIIESGIVQLKDQFHKLSSSSLKDELYQTFGEQLDKFSQILERTVDQLEGRMQITENSMTQMHDKASKIETANAAIENKLSNFIKQNEKQPNRQQNSLLSTLSSYNSNHVYPTYYK